MLNLCANNYLGLADHPEVLRGRPRGRSIAGATAWPASASSAARRSSTRSWSGRCREFLGTEDTILYSSCWDANGGLFETLLGAEDAVISDELNHASIIDGIRLCKAQRFRYRNNDMADLEAKLQEAAAARFRLIATDGVFSMDGIIANLPAICDLADRYDALVMVDDSHAVGFLGPGGRGTPEYHGVMGRIDILTGTLGKALGGGSGGYTSGRREIVEILRQRSRPYLFSNSLPPPIVAGLAEGARNAHRVRPSFATAWSSNTALVPPGDEPTPVSRSCPACIRSCPIMLGDAVLAARMAELLLGRGRVRDRLLLSRSCRTARPASARRSRRSTAARTWQFAVEAFKRVKAKLG